MHYKTLFLVILGSSMTAVHAEYMEPPTQTDMQQQSDMMAVDVYENSHERTCDTTTCDREQQTRADDDPRVQSCIAEAIENKYCS